VPKAVYHAEGEVLPGMNCYCHQRLLALRLRVYLLLRHSFGGLSLGVAEQLNIGFVLLDLSGGRSHWH
jgi:hypothetical protein